MAKNKWLLPLPDFSPTDINYTTFTQDHCVVCHDYSEIDSFAKALTLDKLQGLVYDAQTEGIEPENTNSGYNPCVFNANNLVRTLQDVQEPQPPVNNGRPNDQDINYKRLREVLKKYGYLQEGRKVTLLELFSQYANFPWKNEDDQVQAKTTVDTRIKELEHAAGNILSVEEATVKIAEAELAYQDDKLVFMWLKSAGRPEQVSIVAQTLWLALVKAKMVAKNYDAGPESVEDCVAKARMLYTWLAHSVVYDDNMKGTARFEAERPIADILSSKTEICGGYAEMFKDMYNALRSADDTAKAHTILGYVRVEGGRETEVIYDPARCHAWAAFPLHRAAKLETEFKVVDPTWAKPTGGAFNTEWFCNSNESFSMSHGPMLQSNLHVSDAWKWSLQDFWRADMPHMPVEGGYDMIWIDKRSVSPMTSGPIELAPNNRTVRVSFRNNCKHQASKMKAGEFRLGFVETDKSLEALLKSSFDKDEAVDFQLGRVADGGISEWAAELDIPLEKKKGWIMIYRAVGGYFGAFQTHTRLVMWPFETK